MNLAFDNLKNWWYGNRIASNEAERDEPFFESPPKNFTAWNPEQLEYDFGLQIASKDTSKKLILDVSNYTEDHLDWYSFTVSPESAVILNCRLNLRVTYLKNVILSQLISDFLGCLKKDGGTLKIVM